MRHFTLDILYCLHCKKNPIPKDAFPHFCQSCLDHLSRYGDMPKVEYKQEDLEGETVWDGNW